MDTESFSKTKAMELPRNVVVGHDALHAVGEVCQSLKLGKRALIVADETTMKIAGTTVEMELTARKIRSSRSEEHTSELQSLTNLVCRLMLEKKKKQTQ